MQDYFYHYIQAAFPAHVHHDVMAILPYLHNHIDTTYTQWSYDVMCMGEQLQIPIRIYTNVPRPHSFQNFSDAQQQLLYCLYTRHSDGFVRQYMLRQLFTFKPCPIMIPFVFQLLGEYVIEILQEIDAFINPKTQPLFQDFIQQNPAYMMKTERRIMSYWNEYYRNQYPNFNNYIGTKILQQLKSFA